MERIRRVVRAVAGMVQQAASLIPDSESDVADLYPEHQARGENAPTRPEPDDRTGVHLPTDGASSHRRSAHPAPPRG